MSILGLDDQGLRQKFLFNIHFLEKNPEVMW